MLFVSWKLLNRKQKIQTHPTCSFSVLVLPIIELDLIITVLTSWIDNAWYLLKTSAEACVQNYEHCRSLEYADVEINQDTRKPRGEGRKRINLFGFSTESSHFLKNIVNTRVTALVIYCFVPPTINISNKKEITMTHCK